MIDFLVKSGTWAVSITTLIFTFVPEKCFEKNIIRNRMLTLFCVFIIVVSIYLLFLKFRSSVSFKGHNYEIIVEYGDIFKMDNCKKVINFDECYTINVGDAPGDIKPTSICGQYLKIHPYLDIEKIIKNSKIKAENELSQYMGNKKYKSGKLILNGDDLLMAFAKLDADGRGKFFSHKEFLDCLSLLWEEIDKYYGQKDVCIPILGSGLTRINETPLTQQELLDIIIGSYKLSPHKIKFPYKLHIVCKKNDNFSLNKIGKII